MKRIILATIATITCNLALAAEPGPYLSASVGSAEQKIGISGLSVEMSDTAFQLAGGYRWDNNIGIEAGYTNMGKGTISADTASISSKPKSIHLAATYSYNLTPDFAVTGKLGGVHTRTVLTVKDGTMSDSEVEMRNSLLVGVGVSYAFKPHVALIADYQSFNKIVRSNGEGLKAHVVSVGVRYNF
jgi:OOP family OmpA-OmpF porin